MKAVRKCRTYLTHWTPLQSGYFYTWLGVYLLLELFRMCVIFVCHFMVIISNFVYVNNDCTWLIDIFDVTRYLFSLQLKTVKDADCTQ
jgi:hypothetical protein